jgi:hypothetical protein
MASRDDHYELGRKHAYDGEDRYVFQDPVLQARYDKGYQEVVNKIMQIEREQQRPYIYHDQSVAGLPGRVLKRRP